MNSTAVITWVTRVASSKCCLMCISFPFGLKPCVCIDPHVSHAHLDVCHLLAILFSPFSCLAAISLTNYLVTTRWSILSMCLFQLSRKKNLSLQVFLLKLPHLTGLTEQQSIRFFFVQSSSCRSLSFPALCPQGQQPPAGSPLFY